RIIAPPGHGEVEARLAAIGRAVDEEENGTRVVADALAIDEEPDLALARPVFGAPDRVRRRLRRGGGGDRRQGANAERHAGALNQQAARGMVERTGHRISPSSPRLVSSPPY